MLHMKRQLWKFSQDYNNFQHEFTQNISYSCIFFLNIETIIIYDLVTAMLLELLRLHNNTKNKLNFTK